MSNSHGYFLKIEIKNKSDATDTQIQWADADPMFALNDLALAASNMAEIETKIDTDDIDK